MLNLFILIFIISILLAVILTWLVRYLALKLKIVDQPEIGGRGLTPLTTRKIHPQPVPLLGGVAIFLQDCLIATSQRKS